jgi:hypothetical protein
MMMLGMLAAMVLLYFVMLQTQSLCVMEGKIPQPPAAKKGKFHLRGPQVSRKASKALEMGVKSLGPLDFGIKKEDKAANRSPPPAMPGEGEEGAETWKGVGPLPAVPGTWCSIQDQEIGDNTLSTVANFTRGEETPGGFEDRGEIWVGFVGAFDIAHIEFQRFATYTGKKECLEWTSAELQFTLSFQELLNNESDEARFQMRRFQKQFTKLWRLEWLNEDPCQPVERLSAEHILVKNAHTDLETHSFRCEEEGEGEGEGEEAVPEP